MPTSKYLNIAGSAWQVPPSQPAVPVIPAGATPNQRSTIFNQCVITKKLIMYADHVTRHVCNLITTALPEEFYINLCDDAFEYDTVADGRLLALGGVLYSKAESRRSM